MIWTVVLLGLLLTVFGATTAAALITSSRSQLAEVVARRLRGGSRRHCRGGSRHCRLEPHLPPCPAVH